MVTNFLLGVSSDQLDQILQEMKRPEGTLEFIIESETVCEDQLTIMRIITGKIAFILERDAFGVVRFIHSSPGTGTRIASLDVTALCPVRRLYVALVWSPEEIALYLGDSDSRNSLLKAVGIPSRWRIQVGDDGNLYMMGENVIGTRVYAQGRAILVPPAIESWRDTVQAIRIFLEANTPAQNAIVFDTVLANMVLVMIITGFEAYCKQRFCELEDEGIRPDLDRLMDAFITSREEQAGFRSMLEEQARAQGVSLLKLLVNRRINFQDWYQCKKAYGNAYGIKFGRIGVHNRNLELIQKCIRYRHRIVHLSPLIGMLNSDRPDEEPVFANKDFALGALEAFNDFITKLHEATLRLRF